MIIEDIKHRLPIQIRFNDIDSLGHVNNAIYLSYFDLGKSAYFQAVKSTIIDWTKIDIVVANVNIDYHAPTFMHEKLEVRTQVAGIGNKSMKMVQQLVNLETGELKSSCRTVMVGYHPESKASKIISQEWRNAIEQYEGKKFD
ncbi:MAG: thioesterase family protein [Bacteroidota bacterium]|nr:thioesterase family protein [Bacteroidota bacterium]